MQNPLKFGLGTLTVLVLALAPSAVPTAYFAAPAVALPNVASGTECAQTVGSATGVTATVVDVSGADYCLVTFTQTGAVTWTRPSSVSSIDYLVVGGGGGGGSYRGGGGGGGGVLEGTTSLSSASYVITVGAGGNGGAYQGADPTAGSSSSAFGIEARGGGRGGSLDDSLQPSTGSSGGGGGAFDNSRQIGANGTADQGFSGGSGSYSSSNGRSGGGGGAGGPGQNGGTTGAGDGGPGKLSELTGECYGGGGGGGLDNRGSVKTAGSATCGGGNGGNGPNSLTLAGDGAANTGGGGGGNGQGGVFITGATSGAGGSGVVVIRYALKPAPPTNTSVTAGDGKITVDYTPPTYWGGGTLSLEYQLTPSGGSAGSWTSLGETDGSTDISGLTNNTSYSVKLRAVNTVGGTSYYSDEVSVGSANPRVLSADDYALDFDGSTALVQGSHAVIPSSGDVTVEAWIKLDGSASGWNTIFFQGQSISERLALYYHSDGYFHLTRDGSTVNVYTGSISGTWNHVALSVDRSSDQVTFYMNGIQRYQSTLGTNDYSGTGDFSIGADVRTAGTTHRFEGLIDQFKVWSDVLSKEQTVDSMHSWDDTGVTGSPTLLTHYDFNDNTQATTLRDQVGSKDLTISNRVVSNFSPLVQLDQATKSGWNIYEFERSYLVANGGWTPPAGVDSANVLVVAGGGGGGAHVGGGGGGGGFKETTVDLTSSSIFSVLVGQGGRGAALLSTGCSNDTSYLAGNGTCGKASNIRSSNGQDSVFGAITSIGGGGGGSWNYFAALDGGSGGGASFAYTGFPDLSGAGTDGQGNKGGAYGSGYGTGGGGGAGSDGASASGDDSGDGGQGKAWTVTNVKYAGGGGGGGHDGGGNIAGDGKDGGGDGRSAFTTLQVAQNGSPGTGGGGGGGGGSSASTSFGGFGGSGIVAVAYARTFTLTLDNEGSTSTQSVAYGENPSNPGTTRTGYTLLGWSDDDDDSAEYAANLSDYTMGAANDTIFAVWQSDLLLAYDATDLASYDTGTAVTNLGRTGSTNNATLSSGMEIARQSFDFPSVNTGDFIDIQGTISSAVFQNGYTIDFYAAIPVAGTWTRILEFGVDDGDNPPGIGSRQFTVSRFRNTAKLTMHVANQHPETGYSYNFCTTDENVFDGSLNRYTITVSGADNCTIRVDGDVKASTISKDNSDPLGIGLIPADGLTWDNLYLGRSVHGDPYQTGEIRSLRVFTKALSSTQIDALYDGDLTYQTLTFDSNGGTDPASLVTSGSLRLPSPGTRSGFSFGGWYADETYSSSLGVAGDSYTPGDTSLHALWIGDALTPSFGSPTRTADGFTAQISNFDGDYTYAGSVTTGSVSISGSGLVTLTGVAAGTSSTVTVTTSRTGYSSGSATVTASSLNAALTPTFGTPTSTADGFTVQISNFDGDYTYAGSATTGSVSIDGSGVVTVTGVAVATSSTVTITTTQTGYVQGSATVTASSLSTVTVTFKSNYSGGASDETQTVTASQSTALDENPFTRDGYTFVEWTTASGGSGTAYADEESVSVSSNTILYAQWTKVRTPNLVINLDASNPQSLAEDSTLWSAVRPGSSTSSQTGRGNVAYSDVGGIPALSFDGSGDYFEYTDVSDSRINGDMTLEMWIKPADLRSGWNILATRWFTGYNSQGSTATYDWHFAIRKEGASDFRLNLFTSNSSNIYGSRAFTSNSEWVLVGFTIDASGNQKFFVNGVQDGTTRTGVTHNNSSTAKFFIGDPRAGAGFPGSINAVRMYDTALTSAQMAANFDAEYETFGYRKITFNENVGGGSDTENQYVLNNTATNLSANPFTRDGYRFTGWKTVSSGAGTEYSDNESVTRTSDLTLYAQWELNEYTVTYSKGSVAGANGADQTATKTHGVTLGLLNSDDANDGFSKTGYTVTGWSTNADGSTTDFALGANYTTDAAVTLYPVWTANTYTVSYTYNGATGGNSVSSVDYTVDGILVALPNPTKTGYTFAGWYSNIGLTTSAGAGGASYTPTDDVTLYAKWDANTFTVIYAYNGATGGNSDDDDQYTTGDTVITLPTPTKEGYNFSGWYSDATLTTSVGAAGDDYSPTSNLTIYAKWTAITRSVTYSNETSEVDLSTSGSVPVDSGSYIIGDTVVVKANSGSLARTGYTFEGWVTNSNGTGTALNAGETVTVAEDDITFYPKWEPATYTLTYHANGGSGSLAKASDSYVTGTAGITFPGAGTLSKTGYTFEGWSTSPTGTALADGYTTAQNRTLYAVWDIKSINFSYAEGQDGDGGSLSGFSFTAPFPSGSSENFGTDITLSTSVDAEIDADGVGGIDHQFFGWSDGTTVYQAGDTYRLTDNSPITFTAQWIKVFSVRYALAGGSFAGSDDETDSQCLGTGDTCTDGQVISLNSTPSRPGYTFLGWEDQSGNLKAASASTAISDESYLFTARWEAIDYTLSFNSLGGTRVFNDYTQNIGDRVTMPNPGSKTGYTFGGWSDGSTLFGIGSTFTVGSSSKSFTAQWIADVYTVTYDWQGGTGSTPKASDSYTVGTGDMTLPTAVGAGYSRDGYVFSGWSTSIGGGVESGFRPTADDVLYAVWADGNYTLTYNVQGGSTVSDVSIARTTSTTLATPTRANFTFVGWYTAASGGSKVGDAGDSYTPTATTTLFARWVQDSLYGVDEATLETATTLITADGVVGNDQSASATSGSSRADVVVPGGSLPDGTIISIRYFRDTNRQSSLISGDNTFFFSVLVSWLYGSGTSATVPDTHPLRPIEVTLTNSAIKAGARVYQVIGTQVTDLGVAVADGSVTVELYSDPQLVVAATAPSAPTSVTGSAGDTRATISWTAGSTGGSPVTGYTVTANPGGATCSTATTSCTIGSLSNNTAYTFTVRATNGIGTSSSSTPSSAVTPVGANYDVTFNSNGGSAVADGSFFSGSTVSAPSSPSRSGYVFQGWSTTLDDDTTQVTFPYAPGVTNAITLYALWEAAPPAPTTGGSRGGAANTNAQNILRAPVVVIPRVLGPTQPVAPPRPFTAPVVISPQRGFDPDAGSQARVGGLPATVSKTSPAPGAVSLGVGSVQVGITPQNSPSALRPVAPAAPTDVAVSTGQSAVVAGAGLLPGSQLQVWLPGLTGSSARELARIPVRADGTFESEVSFSARQSDTPVPIGRQVIQVTGFDEQGNQTVVDMTITIGQGDPAPEVTRADNALPDLSPGQSLATSAGVPETVTIQARPETREVAVVSGEWAFTVALAGDSGAVEQVDSGATITLVQAKTASVSGEGFQPGTRVDIWLFSDPTLLGSVTVSADGGFTGDVFLDARYAVVGEHTLQLQGVGADGFIKAANLGVVVQEPVVPDPVTSSPWTFWVLILMSVALAGAVILVAARRRRVRG